jgi:hypothetical protein
VADENRVRIEVGFDGGQVMSALVENTTAESLERALSAADVRADAGDAAFSLDAEDGRYTIALRCRRFVTAALGGESTGACRA